METVIAQISGGVIGVLIVYLFSAWFERREQAKLEQYRAQAKKDLDKYKQDLKKQYQK